MTQRLLSIRRYPVKSMGGEPLDSVELDARGLTGDRWFAVRDAQGHFASGKDTRRFRRRDAVFDHRATTTADGVQVTDGASVWTVGDAALDRHLSARMGLPVTVAPEGEVPHQDAGSVSLIGTATLGWCAQEWGIDADPRRLRANLVVETSEPFAEEEWVDAQVGVGGVVLRVAERIPRCRMIDIDQDGVRARGRWLRPLGAERDLFMGVYLDVVEQGRLAVGDPVEVLRG